MDLISYVQDLIAYKLRFVFYSIEKLKKVIFALVTIVWKTHSLIKDIKVYEKIEMTLRIVGILIYIPLNWIKEVIVSQWKEISILSALEKTHKSGSIKISNEKGLTKITITYQEHKKKIVLFFYIPSKHLLDGEYYFGNINRLIDESEDIISLIKKELEINKEFIGRVETYYINQ